MAQASSSTFRDRKDDAMTIAAKLGVDFLLDGSVRRSGNVLRITADLIDGGTGFSRWSQTFDRVMQDIFAMQSEIADTVARALMQRSRQTMAARRAEVSRAAVAGGDAQRRGLRRLPARPRALRPERRRGLGTRRARAVRRGDRGRSRYAAAHAARARSLTAIANQYGEVVELPRSTTPPIASAHRAIELAPDFADAYSTLGFTLFQGRLDARAAREPFERSRELGGRGDGHGALRAVQRARADATLRQPTPSRKRCCSTR